MASVKLVTFDVTNTILRILGGVGHQYAGVARLYGMDMDPDHINTAFKKHWVIKNAEHPNFGADQNMTSYQWWMDVVKKSFFDAGYQGSENNISQISAHLYVHFGTSNGWEIVPGAQHTLQHLKTSGMKLGVISNFDERLDPILSKMAIRHYFDFVISSKEFKIAKPDTRIFHEALQRGGCHACECLHVGDHLHNDYFGARSAGMTGVLFCKNINKVPEEVDKQFAISNLNELTRFLI